MTRIVAAEVISEEGMTRRLWSRLSRGQRIAVVVFSAGSALTLAGYFITVNSGGSDPEVSGYDILLYDPYDPEVVIHYDMRVQWTRFRASLGGLPVMRRQFGQPPEQTVKGGKVYEEVRLASYPACICSNHPPAACAG